MTEPYVAQILPFAFDFAPVNWAVCAGQTMQIAQNSALYSLLGTAYGGDGVRTFALPHLQDSVPLGVGQGPGLSAYILGEAIGSSDVTLNQDEMAQHAHALMATTALGTTGVSSGNQLASGTVSGKSGGGAMVRMYSKNATKATTALAPTAMIPVGKGVAHNNLQPYLAVNFCIALAINFPQRP